MKADAVASRHALAAELDERLGTRRATIPIECAACGDDRGHR